MLGQGGEQDVVVEAGEELAEVALESVAKTAGETLKTIQRAMGALAHAVGERIGNEAALERRFDDLAKRMVHDPVAKRRGGNQSPFWFVDEEVGVWTRAVRAVAQFGLERQDVFLHAMFEAGDVRMAPLAPRRVVPSFGQIGPEAELLERVHRASSCPDFMGSVSRQGATDSFHDPLRWECRLQAAGLAELRRGWLVERFTG